MCSICIHFTLIKLKFLLGNVCQLSLRQGGRYELEIGVACRKCLENVSIEAFGDIQRHSETLGFEGFGF